MVCVLVLALGCARERERRPQVTVASADTPEQILLGELARQSLEAAGYHVVDATNFGPPWTVRTAMVEGRVDVYWDYTGDTWVLYLGHDLPITDAERCFDQVRQDDALNQVIWQGPAPCQRNLAILMTRATARRLEISSVSDLARHLNRISADLRLCAPTDLYERMSGIRGLERVYGLRFDTNLAQFVSAERGYRMLQEGQCDCAIGYTSDATLYAADLQVLEDDRDFFHESNLAVAVRAPLLREHPDLEYALTRLTRQLTEEAMTDLRRQVLLERRKPEGVARRFLNQAGLLKELKAGVVPSPTR